MKMALVKYITTANNMREVKPLVAFLLLVFIIGFTGCGKRVAGGSEIGNPNSIHGVAVYFESGTPTINALVKLRSTTYIDGSQNDYSLTPTNKRGVLTKNAKNYLIDGSTNNMGEFVFTHLDSGTYLLEVNDGNNYGGIAYIKINGVDVVNLDTVQLKIMGTMQGQVTLDTLLHSAIYAKVYGLERSSLIDPTSLKYSITDLPEGEYSLKVTNSANTFTSLDVPLIIKSNQKTNLPPILVTDKFNAWSNRQQLQLNTSESGANISGDVIDYPVLVRLNAENFDFSNSSGFGEDIQFANSTGSVLNHQIELWDSTSSQAIIWVQIDTLKGNYHRQTLYLFSGNPNFSKTTNGYNVFEKSKGFAGVWHLAEEDAGALGNPIYKNSVENLNHGNDSISSSLQTGQIGQGHYFDTPDHIKVEGVSEDLLVLQEFMVSVWFNQPKNGNQDGTLMTMGDNYGLRFTNNNNQLSFWTHTQYEFLDYLIPIGDLMDGNMHHVCIIYKKESITLIVDGEVKLDGSLFDLGDGTSIDSNTLPVIQYILEDNLYIGNHIESKENSYKGVIDEVRIYNQFKSPSWAKLEYESQRLDSKLIRFP